MHLIFHILISVIVGFLIKLELFEIFFIALGGVLIDLDHIFYIIFEEKIYSVKKAWRFHKKEFRLMRPHFYFLHFLEIIILLMIIFNFINWYLFLIFAGFLLHWILDSIKYIYHYKSFSPWIKYYSLIVYLVTYKNKH